MEDLLDDKDLAKRLKVSLSTIHRWRKKGIGPKPTKLGKKLIRYQPVDVQAYLDSPPTSTTLELLG